MGILGVRRIIGWVGGIIGGRVASSGERRGRCVRAGAVIGRIGARIRV